MACAQVPIVTEGDRDFRQGRAGGAGDRVDRMRRLGPDVLAGAFVSALAVAMGALVVFDRSIADGLSVPRWAWAALFAAFLLVQTAGMWWEDRLPDRLVRASFATQVMLAPVLVLTAPTAGWLPILLVFTSTFAVYRVSGSSVAVIVAVYTCCVGVSVAIRGGRISEIALIMSIYGALQVASALSVTAQLRQARLRRELAVAHAELRTASALLNDSSRADERLRIARELHDVLGHQLTALSLELEVASHQVSEPGREHVVRARSIARDLLGDVRSTVGEVRSRTPVLGESLDRLVAQLPEPVVHLTVDPEIRVDEARAVAVVRCVQEMITNTIRHANADEMWIELRADSTGALSVSVRDDGRASADFEPGHGLQGIRERIEGLGGTVTFSVDRGFTVHATVPAP